MGNESARQLTPEDIKDLKGTTAFTSKEIHDWYKKFLEDSPSGLMSIEEFKQMYTKIFPKGDPSKFAERVFQAYDKDGNGVVDFREFLCTVSVASKGTVDQKLQWAFDLYDIDNSGHITQKEAKEIIQAIFKAQGRDVSVDGQTPSQVVESLFEHLDRDNDGKLSAVEFVIGSKTTPAVVRLMSTEEEKTSRPPSGKKKH